MYEQGVEALWSKAVDDGANNLRKQRSSRDKDKNALPICGSTEWYSQVGGTCRPAGNDGGQEQPPEASQGRDGWMITSFEASYSNRPPMAPKCIPGSNDALVYTKETEQEWLKMMPGVSIVRSTFGDNHTAGFVYSAGVARGTVQTTIDGDQMVQERIEQYSGGEGREVSHFIRCVANAEVDCSPEGQAAWKSSQAPGAVNYMCPN